MIDALKEEQLSRSAKRRQQHIEKRNKYFALAERARQLLLSSDVTDSRKASTLQEHLLNCRTRMDHLNRYCRDARNRRWVQRDISANIQAERDDPKLQHAELLIANALQLDMSSETRRIYMNQAEVLLKSILPFPSGKVVDLFMLTESSLQQMLSVDSDSQIKLDTTLFNNSVAETRFFDVEHGVDLEYLAINAERSLSGSSDKVSIRPNPVSHTRAFLVFIHMLIEQDRKDDALDVILHALMRNPLLIGARLNRVEILKRNMLMIRNSFSRSLHRQKIREEIEMCFLHAKRRKHLSKCYYTMAFLFIDERRYEVAVACVLVSFLFDTSIPVVHELHFIHKRFIEEGVYDRSKIEILRQEDEMMLSQQQHILRACAERPANNRDPDMFRFSNMHIHVKLLQHMFGKSSKFIEIERGSSEEGRTLRKMFEFIEEEDRTFDDWLQWQLRHEAMIPTHYAQDWSRACENIVNKHVEAEILERGQPWSPQLVAVALKNYHRALCYSDWSSRYKNKLQELANYDPLVYRRWVASHRRSSASRNTQKLLMLQQKLREMIQSESFNRRSSKLSAAAGDKSIVRNGTDKPTGFYYEIKAAMAGISDPDPGNIDIEAGDESDFSDDDDDEFSGEDMMTTHLRDELMLRLVIQAED